MRVSYLAGALQALTLKLPVAIHKFMDPADLSAEDFFKRWKQIGGAPREAQAIFGITGNNRHISPEFVKNTVNGFRWRILDMVDPNPRNIVGASVLHTSGDGKFGCLMRLEPNYDSQVSLSHCGVTLYILTILSQMIRLTIRATDDSVAPILLSLIQERLSVGFPSVSERHPPSEDQMLDAFGNVMVN